MCKTPTQAQKHRMAAVAELGCIVCGSPAAIHHTGTYMGGGRDHNHILPLCGFHHQTGGYGNALHAGKKAWEANYGTEIELMQKVEKRLNSIDGNYGR